MLEFDADEIPENKLIIIWSARKHIAQDPHSILARVLNRHNRTTVR